MVGIQAFPFGMAYFQGLLLLVSGSVTQKNPTNQNVTYPTNRRRLPSKDVARGLSTLFATACSIAVLHSVLLSLGPHLGVFYPSKRGRRNVNISTVVCFFYGQQKFAAFAFKVSNKVYIYTLYILYLFYCILYSYITCLLSSRQYVLHLDCCCFQLGRSFCPYKRVTPVFLARSMFCYHSKGGIHQQTNTSNIST